MTAERHDGRRLVAHRGASADYPENSLPALRAALQAGAGAVEFDVQMSADGVPYVIHDPVLMRTAGRLSAVVDLLNDFPDRTAFVELKRHGLRSAGHRLAIDRVLRELQRARVAWVPISFDEAAVATLGRMGLDACGWVVRDWIPAQRALAQSLSPQYLFVNADKVGADPLWPGPWRWVVYELSDWPSVYAWLGRGAERVETNSTLALLGAVADPDGRPAETPRTPP